MENLGRIFQHLKQKWGIKSNWDFFLINCVFSLAGIAVVFVRKPIFHFLGINGSTPLWVKILVYIPILIPAYQINLLVFGFLLGQFSFFWNKEKQLCSFLKRKLWARS